MEIIAYINGDRYKNNGSTTTCSNPNGLLGNARWKWQNRGEFVKMVTNEGGTII